MKQPIITLNIACVPVSTRRMVIDTVLWHTTNIDMKANKSMTFTCSMPCIKSIYTLIAYRMAKQNVNKFITLNEEALLTTSVFYENELRQSEKMKLVWQKLKECCPAFKSYDALMGT